MQHGRDRTAQRGKQLGAVDDFLVQPSHRVGRGREPQVFGAALDNRYLNVPKTRALAASSDCARRIQAIVSRERVVTSPAALFVDVLVKPMRRERGDDGHVM